MPWGKKKDNSIGGIFNKAFGIDANTPQKSRVWGTCGHCNHEGWADKTWYNDGSNTVWYTCLHCKKKDKFTEHEPTYDNGLRRKTPDQPLRGGAGDLDSSEASSGYTSGRDPLKGRKKYGVAKCKCPKCGSDWANTEEALDTGQIVARCQGCGKKLGPEHMK